MKDKYSAVKEKFKDGDWVFGIGKHRGCSQAFTSGKCFYPFSYLDATSPDDFRIATVFEINQIRMDCQLVTDYEMEQ